jgi:hypothetical protein
MSRDSLRRFLMPVALVAAVCVLIVPAEGLRAESEADSGDWDWSGVTADDGPVVRQSSAGGPPPGGEGAEVEGSAPTIVGSGSETAAVPEPAEEAAPVEAASDETGEQSQASASDGWDWDSFGVADEGPTVRSRVESKRADAMATLPAGPRVGETAEPDFEAEPVPAYALFPGLSGFSVIPSVRDRDMHPCGNCHTWTKSDPTPRALKKPHDNFELDHGLHGKGGFWCFTCHTLEGGSALRTLEGQELGFNEAYVLCSQCHVKEARDWAFGAHGKRVAVWQGERKVYNCTVCHYQHRPAIKPREALAGPQVRQGLDRPDHWVPAAQREHSPSALKPWERVSGGQVDHGETR